VKAFGGIQVYLHAFLTLALGEGEWLDSCPWPLYPRYPLDRRLGVPQSRYGPLVPRTGAPKKPNYGISDAEL